MKNLTFRMARSEDCQLYFNWANEPGVRLQSLNTSEIDFENHRKWFSERLNDPNSKMYLFFIDKDPIGQVRFQKKQDRYLVGISVATNFRGKNLGGQILKLATEDFVQKNSVEVFAQIKEENLKSIKIFEQVGYRSIRSEDCKVLEYIYSQ